MKRSLSHALLIVFWTFSLPAETIAARLGNGRLTVGINTSGALESLRWPGPTAPEQIPVGAPTPFRGGGWLLRLGEETILPGTHDRASFEENDGVLTLNAASKDGRVHILYSWFVHPQLDLFCATVRIEGCKTMPECRWAGESAPCTRRVSECAALDRSFQTLDGFAGFVTPEGARIHAFRPRQPSASDWARLEAFPTGATKNAISGFSEGIWLGIGSPDIVAEAICLPQENEEAFWAALNTRSPMPEAPSIAVGPVCTAVTIAPSVLDDAWVASVWMGVGANFTACTAALDAAGQYSAGGLQAETLRHWEAWTNAFSPLSRLLGADTAAHRAFRALGMAICDDAGAIVNIAPELNGIPYASGRITAWGALALDLAGKHDEAGHNLDCALRVLRRESNPGQPRGSMPAAYLPNDGTPVTPHIILQPEQTAWLLAGLWRHGRFLDEQSRAAYYRERIEQVIEGADFIANWRLTGGPAPLPAFDASHLRDGINAGYITTLLAGMESALRIAEQIRVPAPELWKNRRNELEWLIRLRIQRKTPLDMETLFWLRQSMPLSTPFWTVFSETSGQPVDMALRSWLETAHPNDFSDICTAAQYLAGAFGMETPQ